MRRNKSTLAWLGFFLALLASAAWFSLRESRSGSAPTAAASGDSSPVGAQSLTGASDGAGAADANVDSADPNNKPNGPSTPNAGQAAGKASQAGSAGPGSKLTDKADPRYLRELRSLEKMTDYLKNLAQPSAHPKELVRALNDAGLGPQIANDSNPVTGKMVIVRTGEALEGTRYLHAQFFEEDNKRMFLQHISFEFRPSADAMQIAIETLRKKFPQLGQPAEEISDRLVIWRLPYDYELSVKKLNEEDIKAPNPFNAYSLEDVGTARVTLEKSIHPHETHDDPRHDH